VAAYDQDQFEEADLHFTKAYGLSPAFEVLYNIGQVKLALNRPADALKAFERYIEDGSAAAAKDASRSIQPKRRAEVEKEISA